MSPAKLDRCVRSVRAKRTARNAYAVCTASMKGKHGGKKKPRPKPKGGKGY